MENALYTLPVGSVFKYRSKGDWEICEVSVTDSGDRAYMGVGRHLKAGDVIHECVWKKDILQVRKTITLKEDYLYVPMETLLNDTTEDQIEGQVNDPMNQMLQTMMGGAMLSVVAKGHSVTITPHGILVVGNGWSWDWKGHKVNPTSMAPAEIIKVAREAVDAYHEWGAKIDHHRCFTCNPIYVNVNPKNVNPIVA